MMGYHEQVAEKRGHYEQAIRGATPIGIQEVERKESGLMRELRHMEKNLHAMEAVISMLNGRLEPVLIPAPSPDVGLRNTACTGSSLTHQLAAFNSLLSDQLTRLESITQGLDL